MACKSIPLTHLVLYGSLAREGLRMGEALSLRWQDVDLERGIVTLDENKTDDPRSWAMSPGVARALSTIQPYGVSPAALVFGAITEDRPAEAFRVHLKQAGVVRAELFSDTKLRRPIRLHDLRATFVTLALANGKSESWVSDRTGHRSSSMIQHYNRQARKAAELGFPMLAPLDRALDQAHPVWAWAAPSETVRSDEIPYFLGCPGSESNQPHVDFQSTALPTELPGHSCWTRLSPAGARI